MNVLEIPTPRQAANLLYDYTTSNIPLTILETSRLLEKLHSKLDSLYTSRIYLDNPPDEKTSRMLLESAFAAWELYIKQLGETNVLLAGIFRTRPYRERVLGYEEMKDYYAKLTKTKK